MIEFRPGPEEFEALTKDHNVVPVWAEISADLETPVSAYMKLSTEAPSFLLESVEQGERWGRYSFIGVDPFVVMVASGGKVKFEPESAAPQKADFEQTPLEHLRALLESFKAPTLAGLPAFFAGAVGYLGYDVVRYLEKLPQTTIADVDVPEIVLMCPRVIFAFDHLRQRITVVSNAFAPEGRDAAIKRAQELITKLGVPLPYDPAQPATVSPAVPSSSMTEEEFRKAVEVAKEYIVAGDVFQVVLSHRLSAELSADPFDVYRMLRLVNPSAYMFFIRYPAITLFGCSPEPLVKVQGRRVMQRPIAGTKPRGATEAEDLRLEQELLADEKERAEHVMLVDLARNDVGRVAEYGSVKVEELMIVEKYSHVMHLVSQVSGELGAGLTGLDALYASFPAGTVSGAPKIRAMEIIDELEPTRRGPYAGVAGYFDFSGNLDTCIALRTAYVSDGRIHVQAGAGIVADSDPKTEWEETLNKAKALFEAVAMAEKQ